MTSFSSRIAHVLQTSRMREHTLTHPHLCVFCFSQWSLSVCMDSSHHDSESAGLLKGSLIHDMLCKGLRGGGRWWRMGKMLVCLKNVAFRVDISGRFKRVNSQKFMNPLIKLNGGSWLAATFKWISRLQQIPAAWKLSHYTRES